MTIMPGIDQIKREERRLFWRHVEDAALILGGIAAIIAIIITK